MTTSGRSNIIDIACVILDEREKSYMVDAGLEEKVFLPKSQVEVNDDGTVAMPEWLAKEKGLI